MTKGVHVFIATTAGLVAIRAVQHRQGSGLASFVTVSGGANVAAITTRYREFVNPDTSPVPSYFPFDSYHMVIDTDIKQGQSWQLASAIAHLLYANDNLGDGSVEPGDNVIVATGEVEAGSAKISAISHFAQKCLAAQNDLLNWQQLKCRIHFLVPQDNYQQPVPDIAFSLQAVANIEELESYMMEHGMISIGSSGNESFGAVPLRSSSVTSSSKSPLRSLRRSLSQSPKVAGKAANGRVGKAPIITRSVKLIKGLGAPVNIMSFIRDTLVGKVLSAIVAISIVAFGISIFTSNIAKPIIVFESEVQQFDSCQDRELVSNHFDKLFAKTVSSSYANRLANKAFVNHAPLSLEPLPLHRLCSMTLHIQDFDDVPNTIWMISDSHARITLKSLTTDATETGKGSWQIPIPTWQKESRFYILMMFDTVLDKSDEQSIEAYLQQLHESGQSVNVDSLSAWLYRQSLHAYFVTQTLEK